MITEATPLAGLALGFAGSVHCVAMCGGLASALDRLAVGNDWRRVLSHVFYSFGRVASYVVLGALVGGLGQAFAHQLPGSFQAGVRWAVGLLLILIGVSLAWRRRAGVLERAGGRVWKRLAPYAPRLTRLPAPLRFLALGALWGFIPCGLVYSAAAVAALTGSAANGAGFMVAFGLGTLPAVVSMGTMASGLWSRFDRRQAEGVAGGLVALCGVWTIVAPMWLHAGHHAPMCH